jgi:hypothetical protein
LYALRAVVRSPAQKLALLHAGRRSILVAMHNLRRAAVQTDRAELLMSGCIVFKDDSLHMSSSK